MDFSQKHVQTIAVMEDSRLVLVSSRGQNDGKEKRLKDEHVSSVWSSPQKLLRLDERWL